MRLRVFFLYESVLKLIVLVVILVESTLGRPILKALGYLDDLENVSVFCRVVNLLCKKLVSHLLLGCAKRVSVAHN